LEMGRSRVTKHNLSQAQILLSTLDPTSLAYGIAAVFDPLRKQNYLLAPEAQNDHS